MLTKRCIIPHYNNDGPTLGAVIAGGRGERFGSDKLRVLWRGRSLIDHALTSLAPHVDAVVVCGRKVPDIGCLPDWPEPDIGPLGGLCAALRHARAHDFSRVVSAPADVHPLPSDLPGLLGRDGAMILSNQWLIGSWPVALLDALQDHLGQGHRSMRSWIAACKPRVIPDADLGLVNINTPDDLATLEARGYHADVAHD